MLPRPQVPLYHLLIMMKGLKRGKDSEISGTRDECFAVVTLGSMYRMLGKSSIKFSRFAQVHDCTSPASFSAILFPHTVPLTFSGQKCLLSYSLSIFISCHGLSSSITSFHHNLAFMSDIFAHSIVNVEFEDA